MGSNKDLICEFAEMVQKQIPADRKPKLNTRAELNSCARYYHVRTFRFEPLAILRLRVVIAMLKQW